MIYLLCACITGRGSDIKTRNDTKPRYLLHPKLVTSVLLWYPHMAVIIVLFISNTESRTSFLQGNDQISVLVKASVAAFCFFESCCIDNLSAWSCDIYQHCCITSCAWVLAHKATNNLVCIWLESGLTASLVVPSVRPSLAHEFFHICFQCATKPTARP